MKYLSLLLATVLFFTSATYAVPQSQGSVIVNPQTLRKLYLERNVDIAIALNDVQQSKAQVSQSRANLLPAVNLGAVIAGGASFMLTSVSFLLPFLMPSKWMDLSENSHLLKAQGISYYLAQLNGYASAYSVYATAVGDMQLRETLYQQYETFKAMEDQMRLPAELGIIRMEDYLQAQAQTQLALVQVSQLDELIKREKASIRQMLGLSLEQEIVLEPMNVQVSAVENLTPTQLLETVHKNSPEVQQLNSLITSAQYNRWSKAFSFLSGASLGVNRPASGGSFGDLTGTGSVNMGFGYFPSLELSNLHIEKLRLRKTELRQDQAQLIETTLGALEEAQKQLVAANVAAENLQKVYNAEYMRYQAGMTSIMNVLQAGNSLTSAAVNKVKASTSVDTLRISLHRMMMTDEFSKIQKCEIERSGSGGIRGKLGRIFKPEKYKVSLDQVCGN